MKPLKVLIVDDQAAIRRFLNRVVRAEGYTPLDASNLEEAWKVITEEKPEVVVTDYMMPGGTGLDLLGRIRSEQLESAVVLLTGFGTEEIAAKALRLGANNYLKKPVEIIEFRRLLRKYATEFYHRSMDEAVQLAIVRDTLSIELLNDTEILPRVCQFLVHRSSFGLEKSQRFGIQLGLQELLHNAVEHGNLEISREEKQRALEKGPDELVDLYRKRLESNPYSERKVHVDYEYQDGAMRWTIRDEGPGFDFVKSGAEDSVDGRGIYLARLQFDTLEFMGSGNIVRVTKKCNSETPKAVLTSVGVS